MKKVKGFKRLLIFGLAIATIFSIAGITSFAANIVQFGGKDVDLDSNSISISEADEKFVNDITTKEVHFTNNSKINLALSNSTIYGTENNPIKKRYETKIKLDNTYNFAFEWNEQVRRNLDEYTFINKVPESFNIPVPFFFGECEENDKGWNFESSRLEGYSNTMVNIANLHSLFDNEALKNGYTFKSKEFAYTPEVGYINTEGTQKYTSNNGSWFFNAPMKVRYTVDIKPLNAGGTPNLGGNNTVNVPLIKDTNKEFLRNGKISNDFENSYIAPEGTTDQILLGYGASYKINGTTFDDSIVIMKTDIKVADPLSGTGNATDVATNIVGGKTHITVEYGKNVTFMKVDEESKPVAGAEFTVYEDADCKEVKGSGTSKDDGIVELSTLRMPQAGKTATYYMKETKVPNGYEQNDSVYTITINDKGATTISGKGFGENGLVNYKPKDPVITKTSSTPTHVTKDGFITYNLTVTNNYKEERNIIVKDELPKGTIPVGSYSLDGALTGESWNGEWKGTIPGATIDENGKVIEPAKRIFTIVVRVTKDFDNTNTVNNVIKNKASLQTMNLTDNKYGESKETAEVIHYLDPKISYTMKKERVTEPKDDLKGFIAGAGEVIDYKVTLENTGDLDLNINLKDVFKNSGYFTFVDGDEKNVEVKAGKSKDVIFKATVNIGTPEELKKGYLNTVTSIANTTYIDAESNEKKIVDKDHGIGYSEDNLVKWNEAIIESNAYTPVIVVGDPTIIKTSDIKSQSFISKDDEIIYTLVVTNPYSTARDILVTDVLPKQVEANDDYLINGKSQGKAWNGSYVGKIEANGELIFEIPVTVIDSFNNKDHESNTILNKANLKVKDLLTEKYGNEIDTEEIVHYLEPAIGYTMTKERITDPDKGLDGFYAGTGQVIDYKVTLVNTGDITLDIDLEDIFVNAEYFEFVDTNKASVSIEPEETREVIFEATIKAGTPANVNYKNIVTSIAQGWYVNAKTGERVIVNQDNWPDAVTTAKVEDDAITPVITPGVKPIEPTKSGVETSDNSSVALFGSLTIISGLALVLRRKKED